MKERIKAELAEMGIHTLEELNEAIKNSPAINLFLMAAGQQERKAL